MTNSIKVAIVAALALAGSGCGDVDNGRSPSGVVISSLTGRLGLEGSTFNATLLSDVITRRTTPPPCSTDSPCMFTFNDLGQVSMSIVLRDPGVAGITASPSALNQVTFTRYRVEYRRNDGRNTQGVDVPYAFDSAVTFTVPEDGPVTVPFELVRHSAKEEAPLRGLAVSGDIISTIATVTFYGKDQAGNNVTVSGNIGINFGDFADPS